MALRWYRGQDSNLHVLRTVAPKATASTNSATPALTLALFLAIFWGQSHQWPLGRPSISSIAIKDGRSGW